MIANNEVPTPTVRSTGRDALTSAGLDLALKLIANGDYAGATLAAYALPNRIDIKIVDWLVATSGDKNVSAARISEVRKKLADWPGQGLLRLRYEQAIAREEPPAAQVITALGGTTPDLEDAALLLARAYRDTGRGNDAAKIARDLYLRTSLSEDGEKALLADFSGVLGQGDHKTRMDRLLYDGQSTAALRTAARLDKNQQALAKAVGPIINGKAGALKTLDALPAAVKNDPLAVFARIQTLRRANKIRDAARLLVSATHDPKALVDPDAWWIERRLISRELIELGDAKTAYLVAAGHSARSATLAGGGRIPRRLVCTRIPARPNDGREAFRGDRGDLIAAVERLAR